MLQLEPVSFTEVLLCWPLFVVELMHDLHIIISLVNVLLYT